MVSLGNKGCLIYRLLRITHNAYITACKTAEIDLRSVLRSARRARWPRTVECLGMGLGGWIEWALLSASASAS